MDDVGKFIKRFQSPDSIKIFSGDCSYWFALILHRRFIRSGSRIMFDITRDHFGTMVYGEVFDITGKVTSKYEWISWVDLQDSDIRDRVTTKYILL